MSTAVYGPVAATRADAARASMRTAAVNADPAATAADRKRAAEAEMGAYESYWRWHGVPAYADRAADPQPRPNLRTGSRTVMPTPPTQAELGPTREDIEQGAEPDNALNPHADSDIPEPPEVEDPLDVAYGAAEARAREPEADFEAGS